MTKEKFKKVCNTAKEEIINYYSNEELQEILDTSKIRELYTAKNFMNVIQRKLMKDMKVVMTLTGKTMRNLS